MEERSLEGRGLKNFPEIIVMHALVHVVAFPEYKNLLCISLKMEENEVEKHQSTVFIAKVTLKIKNRNSN